MVRRLATTGSNRPLELDWGFDTQSHELAAPHIALKNFSLDVDSFMHGFLGDIVTTVQKYTKPLQPFIDVFNTPVPILSAFDSSQTIGELILKGAGLNEEQRDRFNFAIQIIKTVNTIDLSGSTRPASKAIARVLLGLTRDPSRHLGLVVFSDTAYEALPPSTPVDGLKGWLDLFAHDRPRNYPWTPSFSSGTAISPFGT